MVSQLDRQIERQVSIIGQQLNFIFLALISFKYFFVRLYQLVIYVEQTPFSNYFQISFSFFHIFSFLNFSLKFKYHINQHFTIYIHIFTNKRDLFFIYLLLLHLFFDFSYFFLLNIQKIIQKQTKEKRNTIQKTQLQFIYLHLLIHINSFCAIKSEESVLNFYILAANSKCFIGDTKKVTNQKKRFLGNKIIEIITFFNKYFSAILFLKRICNISPQHQKKPSSKNFIIQIYQAQLFLKRLN
ncbi:transmembrane protein, putative (macronuclear) [Tetrahymena thermophila SB210]|uniref:Transmembrane protein, putative n=1 Tax=Tetrahymena thermophila (strain SB210) TaxID=312017 RepID=W7XLN0_TETTS|nr:transmembrane protein, putative [Tetrahymena thermophila SB210]EWS76574.1 transmembrane protein, putative [Tetrahymena thermophila SB210]|eukprot:XP_012650860.1 transmembrane protein, putative [Tetrahymena thermophila SB210]